MVPQKTTPPPREATGMALDTARGNVPTSDDIRTPPETVALGAWGAGDGCKQGGRPELMAREYEHPDLSARAHGRHGEEDAGQPTVGRGSWNLRDTSLRGLAEGRRQLGRCIFYIFNL